MKDFDPYTCIDAMPSPCISVCRMRGDTRLCEGCFRTIDEIAQWSTAPEEFKRAVWIEIKRRQAQTA